MRLKQPRVSRCRILLLSILVLTAGCSAAGVATEPVASPALPSAVGSQPTEGGSSAAPTATPSPPPAIAATPTIARAGLYVDPAKKLGQASRLSLGSNIGPWTGIPFEMQDEIADAGLTFMRFPGGEWGDDNNLVDYQIDEFIALCRKNNWEPGISVRLLGSTPEQAAAVLRYTNITKGYGVRYWSIGNEPSLFATRKKIDYDTERYNEEWRAFAVAMRTVDPFILLVGPYIHQFDASGGVEDAAGRPWMQEFLKANGDAVDIVSFHRYPFPLQPSDPKPEPEQLRTNSAEWDKIIPTLRALIRETTARDLPVAVTEVNSNWTGASGRDTTPDSRLGAIWWADVLGRLIRERVEIVAHFAVHGPDRQGWGLVEKYKVRPAYHVFQMYRRFGSEVVYASSDGPLVSIFAALRPDGSLTLMLINRAPEPRSRPLSLVNFMPGPGVETWQFDGENPPVKLSATSTAPPDSATLPPESMTLLVLVPHST